MTWYEANFPSLSYDQATNLITQYKKYTQEEINNVDGKLNLVGIQNTIKETEKVKKSLEEKKDELQRAAELSLELTEDKRTLTKQVNDKTKELEDQKKLTDEQTDLEVLPDLHNYKLESLVAFYDKLATSMRGLGIISITPERQVGSGGKAKSPNEIVSATQDLYNELDANIKDKDGKQLVNGDESVNGWVLKDLNAQLASIGTLPKELSDTEKELTEAKTKLEEVADELEDTKIARDAVIAEIEKIGVALTELERINDELKLLDEDGKIIDDRMTETLQDAINSANYTTLLTKEAITSENEDGDKEIDLAKLDQVIQDAEILPLWKQSETDLLNLLGYTKTANDDNVVDGKYFSDFANTIPTYDDDVLKDDGSADTDKINIYNIAENNQQHLITVGITTADGTPLVKADGTIDNGVLTTIKGVLAGTDTADLTAANTTIANARTFLDNIPDLTNATLAPYKDAHARLPQLENEVRQATDIPTTTPIPNGWDAYARKTQEIRHNHTCSTATPCPNPTHHANWNTVANESIEYRRISNKLNGEVSEAELQTFLDDHIFCQNHTCPTTDNTELNAKLEQAEKEITSYKEQLEKKAESCELEKKEAQTQKESEIVKKIITDLELETKAEQENALQTVIQEIKTKLEATPPSSVENAKIILNDLPVAQQGTVLLEQSLKPSSEVVAKVSEYIKDIQGEMNITSEITLAELLEKQQAVSEKRIGQEVALKDTKRKNKKQSIVPSVALTPGSKGAMLCEVKVMKQNFVKKERIMDISVRDVVLKLPLETITTSLLISITSVLSMEREIAQNNE
ncbi:10338_t:CDS:2 [Funneliformis geosporum]|nr:10338_t:CDS:2 [Funneliformis geosporum]